MGYEVVEFWAPYYDWTPAQAKDVRKLLDDLGIRCNSTHNSGTAVTPEGLKKAIELNQIIGSKYIIQASAPPARSIDDWKQLAAKLTSFSEQLKPLGMGTGYHNHQVEWRPLEGQRPMDVLAANTSKDVVLQFDVGTCVEVGADPIAWINANPGRIKSVHCKDWGAGQGRGYNVAFGEGDAPWLKIFDAVEKTGGIEYYLIEQEQARPDSSLRWQKSVSPTGGDYAHETNGHTSPHLPHACGRTCSTRRRVQAAARQLLPARRSPDSRESASGLESTGPLSRCE